MDSNSSRGTSRMKLLKINTVSGIPKAVQPGAQAEVRVQQRLERNGDGSRRHQQGQEEQHGQECPVALLPSDKGTQQQADRCLHQPRNDHDRKRQIKRVVGGRVGHHLDPALPADELDGTDPVPVSEREHQDADQRNKRDATVWALSGQPNQTRPVGSQSP